MPGSRPDAVAWLRQHGHDEVADTIEALEADWKRRTKRTRRNWWDVLAGTPGGKPRTVDGHTFPVFAEAQQRQNRRVTPNAVSVATGATPYALQVQPTVTMLPAEFTPTSLPAAVQTLFRLNDYEVWGPVHVHGAEIDLVAQKKEPFAPTVYIEATVEYVDNTKYGKDLTKFAVLKEQDPACVCIIVSSTGFTPAVAERAKQARIQTLTYSDLWKAFQKFEPYIQKITGDTATGLELRELDRIYEEAYFEDELGKHRATDFLARWRTESSGDHRWLIIVGDYGTGKTTLTRILQY